MEVGMVSTSGAAMQQQYPVERRDSQQSQDRSNASAAARKDDQVVQEAQGRAVQNRSRTAETANRSEEASRQPPPKPVVNAQGQKTGTIINTTA